MKRKIGIFLLLVFLLTGGLLQIQKVVRAKKAYTGDNLIRLHVIANSNDESDQQVKYRVRDALVEGLKPELRRASSYQEAKTCLEQNRAQIAQIAEQAVAASGFSYPVRVEIGKFSFPARAYGKIVYPAGQYEAVRVILGKGQGANWWCVLFPPFCFVDISSTGSETTSVSEATGVNDEIEDAPAQGSLGKGKISGEFQNREDDVQDLLNLRIRIWDWLQAESNHLARLISS